MVTVKEGSTEAPIRHPLAWGEPDFFDPAKIDEEMRRVFDICHSCRRCFNLCDSFPRLFDLIDDSETGELDSVESEGFAAVVEACTLCDMCFMTKCPYVPPHEFNLDFPHLMLRCRAAEKRAGRAGLVQGQLAETERNGRLAGAIALLANWASSVKNGLTRSLLQGVAGIHREAVLPLFHRKTFVKRAREDAIAVNREAPAFGRKAVLYATCFVNYNNPQIGVAARAVLAHNGVETEVVFPSCCGMPKLEQGDLDDVAAKAKTVSAALSPWIDKGYDVIALVPSCALMLKFEWPLILPDDEGIRRLAQTTSDITEYIVDMARNEGLAPGLKALRGGVALHFACHARAQNMGPKAAEMLRLIPDNEVSVIERCSGHGGSWGIMKKNFEVALKVGKPVARDAAKADKAYLASECPLAAKHILQGVERVGADAPAIARTHHPIEIFAEAYGLGA